MKKTFKVVMLPTEKASDLVFDYCDQLCYKAEDLKHSEYKRHLYIISDDEIKEGDWYLDGENNLRQRKSESNHKLDKKVVATTDKSLTISATELLKLDTEYREEKVNASLPQLPESFIQAYIKAYNEGKPITEVDLEVEEHFYQDLGNLSGWTEVDIKTRPDNTVIVHQSKKLTDEEMYLNMEYYREYCNNHPYVTPQDWIKYHKHF